MNNLLKTSPETIDFPFLRTALTHGACVTIFLRHSERPPIRHDDREFGKHLGLTPRGIALTRSAGKHLAGTTDAQFFASPMTRCRLTAQHIAAGMGINQAIVEDADTLGVRGFFYEDPYAVQKMMQQQGYMAYMLDYLRTGSAPCSRPIGDATKQTIAWLQQQSTAACNFFVSHDIFVAAILTGLRLRTYTEKDWVGFLHGFALIRNPGAIWHCHPCVPLIRPPV